MWRESEIQKSNRFECFLDLNFRTIWHAINKYVLYICKIYRKRTFDQLLFIIFFFLSLKFIKCKILIKDYLRDSNERERYYHHLIVNHKNFT